jgi:hypothetical protein
MKKVFAAIAVLIAATIILSSDGFCEGWEAGYKAGYCYQEYNCLAPLVPLCPLPRLGEENYQGGYNRGFLAGLNARNN